MFMLSGDRGTFAVYDMVDKENKFSHGTVVAGEARYLNASLATLPSEKWTSSFVDLRFGSTTS